MSSRLRRRMAAAVTLLCLGSIALPAGDQPPAGEAGTGELWEVTSQMSMQGMALPAQKSRVCAAREWKEPPGGADERHKCKSSEFKLDGPKATWKVTCSGPPAMTGEGEITRDGADAYTGSITFTSAEGAMTVKLNGHKVGACEPPRR